MCDVLDAHLGKCVQSQNRRRVDRQDKEKE